MGRGRPSHSEIREKITAVIDKLSLSYGYEIYKHYRELFGNATSRVIYYHLKKGVSTGEFVTVNVERVLGSFSWGDESERVYYALGPFSKSRVEWLSKTSGITSPERNVKYDWFSEVSKNIDLLKKEAKASNPSDKQKLVNKCDKLITWVNQRMASPEEYVKEIDSIKTFLK